MRWIAWAGLCGVVCGCSSSAYDADYARRLADYRVASEFAPLRVEATTVGDGRAELRLPVILANQLDGSETPRRATPPFIADFPGFTAAYEGQIETPAGRFPVVLTVGVVPTAQQRKDEVAAAILRQVRLDEEFGKATWIKARTLDDPAAAIRTWDVLELSGGQPFQVTKAGVVDEKRLPGTTEVWLSAEPGQKACVILAWRVPDDAAASLPVPATAQLTARTVRIVPQP
jgi:hypothetical protein